MAPVPPVHVVRSNRVEALLDALVEIVREPAGDPLHGEHIVVHSRAMAVWLTQRLAERLGVWVPGGFPFPRRFVEQALAAVLGSDAAGAAAWSRSRLTWAILAELPARAADPRYAAPARILADDPRPHAAWGLADGIAEVFDAYLAYRPDMVRAWERGDGDDWQADLWRALVGRLGPVHLAALAEAFVAAADDPEAGPRLRAAFGPRVIAFSIASLPPLLVRVLHAVSRHLQVHLMIPMPWRGDGAAHPVAASFGSVVREFEQVLAAELGDAVDDGARFVAPAPTTALSCLQRQLLDGRAGEPTVLAPDDDSIAIHACHAPMREVEVLHDQLLAILSAPDAPAPHEIVVLMSDVEAYAPLVEAVLSRERGDRGHVPYSLADRAVRSESPVVDALFRIVALVGGRATASEVLDLLALSPVQRRFDIRPDDVDRIAQWIADAGIRWGIDEAHRAEHEQPRFSENTWQFGLRRILLGWALPGEGRDMFAGVLPYDEIEGSDALLAGRLARLCDELLPRLRSLGTDRPVTAWQTELLATVEALIADDGDGAWGHGRLRAAIDAAVEDALAVGLTGPVALGAMMRQVAMHLDEPGTRGLLGGGVTFCAMLPMRGIPFSVVCLLGMSDGAFPRPTRRLGFDALARAPRPGDRSRRAEDRWSFLEAIAMARRRLLVTYVGQSMIDNEPRPPSVVVSELLDVMAESFSLPEHAGRTPPASERLTAMTQRLVLRHPMQPFSPRYFGLDDDPRLFSYAEGYREGAAAMARPERGGLHAPLLTGPLPPAPEPAEIALDRLAGFFRAPATELLKRRLGIHYPRDEGAAADREPMELEALEDWKVGDRLLQHRLDRVPVEASRELLRASGLLPLGRTGEARWDALLEYADPIAQLTRAMRGGDRLPAIAIDVQVVGTRVTGRIADVYPSGVVRQQYGKLSGKHLVAAWVVHLAVGCARPGTATFLLGRAEKGDEVDIRQFVPVADAADRLAALVELYRVGQCEPLLLFPRASLAFEEARRKDGDDEAGLRAAREIWTGRKWGERDDPYHQRWFGDDDPIAPGYSPWNAPLSGGDFATISRAVMQPLLDVMKKL